MGVKNTFKGPILLMLTAGTIVLGTYSGINKEISLTLDGQTVKYDTVSNTVESFLVNKKIKVPEGSRIEPNLNTKLTNNMDIEIVTQFPIKIKDGKRVLEHETNKTTVAEVLEECNIGVKDKDILNKDLNQKINSEDTIEIIRVSESIKKEVKEIPFKIKIVEDNALLEGKTKTKIYGKKGKIEISYKILSKNGNIVSKTKVAEKVLEKPQNEIVKKGSLKTSTV
ncbi:G5 domain-containing protein [Romboutsia lituseburensis]|uniref:G5 domain-containing protein n=1 Tax=Romboutsia lituseburensis TaxID=1537 RepID=UPI00215AB725|nr:G5 domain-containing protein [Romboutsia lituseburensis]MCR8746009.1 G5 domain-containing protein [Romboutsia lituseburensis]